MNQALTPVDIDFSAQTRHLHVDHVVDRCGAARLLPDVVREHLARDDVPLVTKEILQELELASSNFQDSPAARNTPCHDVEVEIAGVQSKDLGRAATPQQCANASEELRGANGLTR